MAKFQNISMPATSLKLTAETLKKMTESIAKYNQATDQIYKTWWSTTQPLPPADTHIAILCGAQKRKNFSVELRSHNPHPPVIERKGEYFIGGEPRRHRRGKIVVEETNYRKASKFQALRHAEKVRDKEFCDMLNKVGEQFAIDNL